MILVRKPVGSQIVSTRSRWLSTVYFHPLYRGTWFPTIPTNGLAPSRPSRFPSAISRYLVSNCQARTARVYGRYEGVSIRYIAVLGFQQGEGLAKAITQEFPSAISRYLVSDCRTTLAQHSCRQFPSAISRYLVSDSSGNSWLLSCFPLFPSAISRYLVSDVRRQRGGVPADGSGFHPLYRGTWYLTHRVAGSATSAKNVSIRYIAVLGI